MVFKTVAQGVAQSIWQIAKQISITCKLGWRGTTLPVLMTSNTRLNAKFRLVLQASTLYLPRIRSIITVSIRQAK